ncbi:MAG: GDP-mannose 4,6-dehydratase [Candidatus Poribacteria bacterium]|nr:GDP-mannose 4,6-dehydratase [Candidatus Poribacteria bacterium]
MKAFVTGGTGFIGSHLVELLVGQGYQVTALIRETSNLRWLNHLLTPKSPRVQLVTGNLQDSSTLVEHIRDAELVFHLAGLTKAPDAATYDRVNAQGTKSLIEACLNANCRLTRFVYCSSLAASGPSPDSTPIAEDVSPQPLTDYGRSKLKGEQITREYADCLPMTIIRPPAVYGPRDTDIFLYFQFINKGLMPILGDENRLLSLVHAKDLVQGIYAAAVSDRALGQAYFLTDGKLHSWEEIASTIAGALEKRPLKLKVPFFVLDIISIFAEAAAKMTRQTPTLNRQKVQDLKQTFWICDSTKAEEQIGYRPAYPLEKGIPETVAWYREHGWLK